MNQNAFSNLLKSLQEFHNLVGIAFPMETVKIGKDGQRIIPSTLEGSRIFIPSALFGSIEKKALEVQVSAETLQNLAVVTLWRELPSLLSRRKTVGRHGDPLSVNKAIVILYVTSGVLHNYFRIKIGESLLADVQQPVKSIGELLELAGLNELKNNSAEDVVKNLTEMCKTILAN